MRSTLKDARFLATAHAVAQIWSKDPSTKVGAVVVGDHPGQITIGYNGLPPGLDDTPKRLQTREIKYQLTMHAETNALANVVGFTPRTLYCTHPPCVRCALAILAARTVRRVVVPRPTGDFAYRWRDEMATAGSLLAEAGVELVLIDADADRNCPCHQDSDH